MCLDQVDEGERVEATGRGWKAVRVTDAGLFPPSRGVGPMPKGDWLDERDFRWSWDRTKSVRGWRRFEAGGTEGGSHSGIRWGFM
jgi:hypothetical protein